jgi:nicotinamidase-related amidase
MVAAVARLCAAARAAGVAVVHGTAARRADGRGSYTNARLFAGVRKASLRLSPGTDAVGVPESIGVDPADVVLPRHHGLGPMTGTQLDPMLRNLGVTTIVGVGVSVNIGMTNFAFHAVNLGYQFEMPTDAVAGVPDDYAAAVVAHTLSLVATLTTTDAVLAAWSVR